MEPLSQDDIERMSTPLWERAKAAVDAGDGDEAKRLIDSAVAATRSLQDYSLNWITSLLTFVGRELGEEAVEATLREFGDHFIRPRRTGETPWHELPAATRARAIARAMLANHGEVEVEEDDDRITLRFRCGSGGWLIDSGAYDGEDAYLELSGPTPVTFGRERLPVYCAHCSVNNEMQAIEWDGYPVSEEFPSEGPGGVCVHHVYRDADATPDAAYQRVGADRPQRGGARGA